LRLTVLGSGGALSTPRPACGCRNCVAARGGDSRARRGGPALFVHEARLLIDTPENATAMLEDAGIDRVDHLFVSHWHPDHTAGFRVLEQLNWGSPQEEVRATTEVWLNQATAARKLDDWRYFERRGLIRLHVIAPGTTLDLGSLRATWFAYGDDDLCSGWLLEDQHTRVLIAVDEIKGLADRLAGEPWGHRPDLLVAEAGWFDRNPEGRVVPADSFLRAHEAEYERDVLALARAVDARSTLLVHINDLVGHRPAELDARAAETPELAVRFAHDGLTIEL
jgi:phosphoribosyl 1,2-cyclic phosphate phosphodiesterase